MRIYRQEMLSDETQCRKESSLERDPNSPSLKSHERSSKKKNEKYKSKRKFPRGCVTSGCVTSKSPKSINPNVIPAPLYPKLELKLFLSFYEIFNAIRDANHRTFFQHGKDAHINALLPSTLSSVQKIPLKFQNYLSASDQKNQPI